MGFPLFNYLILTHCKVFWIFLLLSQTEHLKSLQWEYHVASYNSHYFSLFHFAEFCFYLSGHFLETLLNYLPAESSQFGVLCSFFDWCIFLTVFLVYWVFFVFVFFPVSSCPLTEDFILSYQFKVLLPRTIIFFLSKLVTTVIKKIYQCFDASALCF